MTKLAINHKTPSGTIAYEACLYFDDGDDPNAGMDHIGYFADEAEATRAMRDALAAKPGDVPSEAEHGGTAGWCGVVERGVFTLDEDDEWFVVPSFERDENYDSGVEYRGANNA